MTVKLVILYAQPVDATAFDDDYRMVHAPLVEALPGLERWESARVLGAADGGEQTVHRLVELYFQDEASLEAALSSEEGRATGRDYRRIAPPGSRMFIADLDA